jgi:hydroxymethylpyrimidine/phosphomethylpyrimidine kinase|tara:strand:- start:371 stop:1177 length:807 start_codon:yes stop_codon:yes gene_type:complete
MSIPVVLTIAGSDSGGGAGVQADIKTFASIGTYGTSVITAVTAQNSIGVSAIQELNIDFIEKQIDSVCSDMKPVAVKTGMLFSKEIITLVANKAEKYGWQHLIVDPVMVSTAGDHLIKDDAVASYVEELLPRSFVVTPNIPEATRLTGLKINSDPLLRKAATEIHNFGVNNVIIKGGHDVLSTESIDALYDGHRFTYEKLPRIDSANTHGTGCSFASAITAYIANGNDLKMSFKLAKNYVWNGIKNSYQVGEGSGPINHMWNNTQLFK